jgi:hypothetical protein
MSTWRLALRVGFDYVKLNCRIKANPPNGWIATAKPLVPIHTLKRRSSQQLAAQGTKVSPPIPELAHVPRLPIHGTLRRNKAGDATAILYKD